MTELHTRALTSTTIERKGKTLEGMALYWNRPSSVTDDGVNFYRESFRAKSVNKTLTERGSVPLPLGMFHPWQPGSPTNEDYFDEPIGWVRFFKTNDGLAFRAHPFDTPLGNDVMENIKDFADVSIGFLGYKAERIGDIVVRTEIALNELSLAPNGTAQHDGTQVLQVRANTTPNLDKFNRTLRGLYLP